MAVPEGEQETFDESVQAPAGRPALQASASQGYFLR